MPNPIIQINGVTKRYGSAIAVNNISFEVKEGEIFGILGPNGSGKTTIINLILGLRKFDGGSISVFGSDDLEKGRKNIGTALDTGGFYPFFSGEKNLQIASLIKGGNTSQIRSLLNLLKLFDDRKKPYKQYSHGMKQRLSICSALLGSPCLLIFDEPTNGLDPRGIVELRNLIIDLSKDGKTIIVASHLLSEMEKVCSHAVILEKGKLVISDAIANLTKKHGSLEDAFMQLTDGVN